MRVIQWNNKARKQIKRIPRHYQDAILDTIDKLAAFPNTHNLDIVALKKHHYDYRMRVGRYRVFFNDQETLQIIAIMEVKKRDERTY